MFSYLIIVKYKLNYLKVTLIIKNRFQNDKNFYKFIIAYNLFIFCLINTQ